MPELIQAILCVRPTSSLRKIDTGFSLVLGRLCTLAREMYARISSASAKSRPLLDLDMMEQIPAEVEELSSVLNFYEQRLTRFYGAKWPKRLAYCSKVARFSCKGMLYPAVSREGREGSSAEEALFSACSQSPTSIPWPYEPWMKAWSKSCRRRVRAPFDSLVSFKFRIGFRHSLPAISSTMPTLSYSHRQSGSSG